ncbi:alpha/beta hydrolase [Streptomonospora sp. S1-112]|uniref:Alpha/beta hydrolase n=2 Tax=Streptomonospora mangrovi TaxID=2883123 RepID=A0A9X3NN73_9ACTN|nr:alpha/beta fold hydrolase [Streptomonospora mangrovi]MDA0566842.1 alpha/beta hydrolase [Streptomonospora mangrovi]
MALSPAPARSLRRPARIYRGAAAERRVRAWCRSRLAADPRLRERTLATGLGATPLFTADGGDGTPVLLLPGTNFNSATGLALARALAPDRTVHLVDLPGQPGLAAPLRPGGDRLGAYGAWLGEVLAGAAERRVLVLGHSLGAAVALAAEPSDRVAGLALVNPAGLAPAALSAALMRVTLPWLAAPSPGSSARLLAFMSGPGAEVPPELADWMTLVARSCRTSLAPGPLPEHAVRRWRDTPVHVATGSHDRFFPPARLAAPARDLLAARVDTVEGAGHLAPHEDPARVRALLRDLDAAARS